MRYRVPHNPRIEHEVRHRARLARYAGLVILWLIVLLMTFVAERKIPDQHLPWKPLSVVDPVGLATRAKAARAGADPTLCRGIMSRAGVVYAEVPDRTEGDFCKMR